MGTRAERRGTMMQMKRVVPLFVALIVIVMTAGCGDEEPSIAPTTVDFVKERQALAARDKSTTEVRAAENAASPTSAGEDTSYAVAEQDYFYDPRGKRDPFRSFQFMDADDDGGREFGPLEDFELEQLELSAVIWDANNPRALILDPGGRAYIVREGSQIGKNSGQVIHIGDNLVLVKETYENLAGERTTKDVELRIRLSQGG